VRRRHHPSSTHCRLHRGRGAPRRGSPSRDGAVGERHVGVGADMGEGGGPVVRGGEAYADRVSPLRRGVPASDGEGP
uniref:Uncharacterized protein n=1 Tax=Triticum urartu TaxID=4572 RepID=A0A8R7P2K8_TRIUA